MTNMLIIELIHLISSTITLKHAGIKQIKNNNFVKVVENLNFEGDI
jgi:hypothetical protein